MPELITASIDVTLIDKKRLKPFKRQSGKDGQSFEFVLIPLSKPDKYGNTHIIKQSVTKEEREAKLEMPILGNGKVFSKGGGKGGPSPSAKPPQNQDDVPF